MEKAQLIVGIVRGTHGFSGEVKVESTSGEYEHLLKLKEVTLLRGTEQRAIKVESSSLGSSVAYVKFAGIDSDLEAKKYNGWEILVPRKYCKPLEKDEWYIEDLKNCSLVWLGNDDLASLNAPDKRESAIVGTITDVLEGGGGYLLEVSISESCKCIAEELKFTEEGKNRSVLIPFNNTFIGKVDVKNDTVQLMHLWILE